MSPTDAPRGLMARLRRPSALAVSAALLASTAALAWWGSLTPVVPQAPVTSVSQGAPAADAVYVCPAAPEDTIGAVETGTTSATTSLTVLSGTATWQGEPLAQETGTTPDATGGLLVASPRGGDTASAAGAVTTVTVDGDLRGLTTASCVPPQAVSWVVGGSAALGSSAQLRLTNPGTTTVTASVSLYGATGPVSSATGNEVAVPAGETVSVLLEAAATGEERLAVSVESDGGVLAAVLVTESLDGETAAGVDVLTAGAAPATSLTVPGVVLTDPAAQGQVADEATGAVSSDAPVLRVVNPGAEAATVSVSLLGPDGEQPLAGATALVVEPGAVSDVSLAGTAPGAYGVRVVSDVPVTAAVRLVRSGGEHPARSGALVHDVAWVQAQTGRQTRAGILALPQGEGLTSSLVLANAASADGVVTLSAPDGTVLREVLVPASSALTVDLTGLGAAGSGPSALVLTAGEDVQVTTALVTTVEAGGEAGGTLIGVLAPVAQTAAASSRQLLLR